jgi:hypothetical protein
MVRVSIALVCALLLTALAMPREASAGVQTPLSAMLSGIDEAVPVTFWARPYPHGYAGWRGCRHRVRVETRYGWRWRRVCVPIVETRPFRP